MMMTKEKPAIKSAKVLIIDDDQPSIELIRKVLEKSLYEVMSENDGDRGLAAIKEWQPDLVLCDIVMPSMDGYEVLKRLQNEPNQTYIPLVFVSSKDDYDSVRKGMNLGADDYLIKPFSLEQLTTTVRSRLIRNRSAQSKYREYSLRMRNQLEWLLWKEKAKEINKLNMGKVMINNFRHTISQGVGDGALVTQIEMIDMCKKLDNDNYRVPVKILDSLISKAQSVRNWLESLEKTAELAEAEYAEEVISTTEISQIISESCNNVEKFRSIKNQKIVSNDPQCNKEISGNARVVGLAIRELLTNAFKFSPENSKVKIIQFVNIDIFSILIINEIEDMPLGISGIPDDCENEIFEPYHRLNHTYDERFYDEEVGMGIGLTVVRGAVNQIGGNVSIYEGMDHTDFISPTKKVIAELNFKVVTNGKH